MTHFAAINAAETVSAFEWAKQPPKLPLLLQKSELHLFLEPTRANPQTEFLIGLQG